MSPKTQRLDWPPAQVTRPPPGPGGAVTVVALPATSTPATWPPSGWLWYETPNSRFLWRQ